MFKKGDFVKIKPNTKLESGEIVNNWAGEVQDIYPKEKCCLITLDAQTIDSLDDPYLRTSMEVGAEPFEYIFEFKDLELSERRDTDEEIMIALDRLFSRMIALEEELENELEEFKDQWLEEFETTAFFDSLNEFQKENSGFVIDTFMDYMYNYEYVKPNEWRPSHVKAICLDIVPRKITADIETFENYGETLIQYFKFLGANNYISNAPSLVRTVEKIKDQIPIEAANPNNWGMAKSMLMSAQDLGFDISDEEDINQFMMLQQSAAKNEMEKKSDRREIPLREDPFKGIKRNERITVKYSDGRIVENIKFKKVESELRSGACEIINK